MYDHNVPSGSPEDARIFGEILTFSKEYGTRFLQAKGTGLQYLLKEEVKPGQIVVTGSRHSSVLGAVGALGIGISNTELARVLESGKYHVEVPETLGVLVKGSLGTDCGIVDAALCFLKERNDIQPRKGRAVPYGLRHRRIHRILDRRRAGGVLSESESDGSYAENAVQ